MKLENLAKGLDEEKQKAIAATVLEEFEADDESRSQWLNHVRTANELYHQIHSPETPPWDGASEESVPLVTEAVNHFFARGAKALFPTRSFISAKPLRTTDEKMVRSAEKVAKHMSFQLTTIDKNYRTDKTAMLQAIAKIGSDFSKTYYDVTKRRNVVERVRAVDLVVPYGIGPRAIEDLPRKTEKIVKPLLECEALYKNNLIINKVEKFKLGDKDDVSQQVTDKVQGLNPSDPDMINMGLILQQQTFLDLDGSGLAKPYTIKVDYTSKKLLAIHERWDKDVEDKIREEVKQNLRGDKNARVKKEELQDALNLRVDLIQPKEIYTHYKFIQDDDGFYGLGYGTSLLRELNIGVNKMMRQQVDAGELANMGNMSGFVNPGAGIKGDELVVEIGKMTELSRPIEDIRKGIMFLDFAGPNQAQKELMNDLIDITRRLASTTDSVTGDIDKVMQPLTIMTLLESSLQMPTAILEQVAMSFEGELDKLFKLNQKHILKGEKFVLEGEELEVSPEDYAKELIISPMFDPKEITKQQKIAKAQTLYEFVFNDPVLVQSERARKEAHRRYLTALEVENIDEILEIKENTLRIDDQAVENMFYLLPIEERPYFSVEPDQDHEEHIKLIDDLIETLNQSLLPDIEINPQTDPITLQIITQLAQEDKVEILTSLNAHRRKHLAYLYAQDMEVDIGQGLAKELAKQPNYTEDSGKALKSLSASRRLEDDIGLAEIGEAAGAAGGLGLSGPVDGGEGLLGIVPPTEIEQ